MVHVRIPATSANVGSGFDALGLALQLYNEVEMEEYDGIEILSADLPVPVDEHNLVYKSAKYLYDLCGKPLPGLKIRQTNGIPIARGLGSSSACIIGGLCGANGLLGEPLAPDELLDLACRLEGHPDNVSPAMLGGLVTAVIDEGKLHYVKQDLRDDLCFAAFIPDFELKTSQARSVLPGEIPRRDAVYNLSRAALLAVSLYTGSYGNLRVATGDRLHQPYRLGLIPHAREVFAFCYRQGAYAAYLSGSGSTLVAMLPASCSGFEAQARSWLDQHDCGRWMLRMLRPDNTGAVITKSPNRE